MKKWLLLLSLSAAPATWNALEAAPVDLMKAPLVWPTIRAGERDKKLDARVSAVQYLLRARGFYKGRVDGVFGPQTVRAVKAFQKSRKLRVDGVAGPQTLPRLVIPVRRGSSGDAVRAAQVLARGAFTHDGDTPNEKLAVDGTFGRETHLAVQIAQESIGGMEGMYLKGDGVMGPRSWCLMLGGRVKSVY